MYKIKIIILLISIITLYLSFSNYSKSYSGTIIDSETKELLVGVKVKSDLETVYSDFDGNFHINGKPTYQYISYQTDSITSDTVFMSQVK